VIAVSNNIGIGLAARRHFYSSSPASCGRSNFRAT
jgi:hypothetical protein